MLTLALAVAAAVAGCGEDTEVPGPADDRPTTQEVVLVSQTAGGGEPASEPTDVSAPADLASYVEQFDDRLATKVTEAAQSFDGDEVLAQVVAVGCDVPPGARLSGGVLVPEKVASPLQECFAPVTTVALAAR